MPPRKSKAVNGTRWSTPTDVAWNCRFRRHRYRTVTVPVLQASRDQYPLIQKVFADSVYAGKRIANATSIFFEIVRKLPDRVGFQVLPRRWVVERFFTWINRNRRLAKDFEGTIASAKAFLYTACVILLTRRLASCA